VAEFVQNLFKNDLTPTGCCSSRFKHI